MNMSTLLSRLAAGLLIGLAVTGARGDECDLAESAEVFDGRLVVRVAPGVTVGAALGALENAAPGVSFTIVDVSLADRDMYLLEYAPVAASNVVEDAVDTVEDAKTLVWGELLREAHDPEGRTGSVWFHSVSGAPAFQD